MGSGQPVDSKGEAQAFGDLLRWHRVLAGMSQEELAERALLSTRAISDLERGVKRTPRRDTVKMLVRALELSGESQTAFVTAARKPAARRSARPAARAPADVSHALVTTKVRPPRLRQGLVPRPRLRAALTRSEDRRLTLISAPAGFGKTTLLGEWLGDRSGGERSVAWVSLDESDNDPARFLAYLIGALRTIEEGIGEGVLASLRSPELPPVEAVAGALVNELADISRTIAIVLDDYHLIRSGSVHEAVAFLLEHLPENIHLVVSGRADPPLPLSKLRARGEVNELRAPDLRLTSEEATAFLKDAMGLALSGRDVAALEEVTEGWVAALQLAALSMQGRGDVSGFVEAFSGSNRHVLDFLGEEVLGRQPEPVRGFLLRTSVLQNMAAPLCDALMGRSDGQQMLERLERDNLFVVPLDDERRWYRYHRLFAEFLRGLLGRENPELPGELHLRASGWHEENGLIAEAIGHVLSAPDHDLAARLIEEGVEGAVERGEGATALRWLEALPTEAKRLRPRLFVEHAVALVITGRPNDAEPLLKEAERAASGATDGEEGRFLLGFVSAVRSWRARLRGDAPEAVHLARRALSLLPDEEAPVRGYAAVRLGDALRTAGDLAAAGEAYAEAAEIGRAARHAYVTLAGTVMHARVLAEQGRLRDADEAFRRALRLLTEAGFGLSLAAGIVHIGMADLRYERDDLDGAEREINIGVELAERTGEVGNLVWACVTLSRTKQAQGNEEGALEAARKAERVARNSGADLQIALAASWMARLRMAQGDLAEAAAFVQERAANAGNAARMADRITSARLLHARGRYDEVLRLLDEPQEAAETTGRTGDLIETLALRALALWARGEKERAVATLARALALAEPEGYVRTFVDEGTPMADLLSAVLEARQGGHLDAAGRVSTPYLARLLAALAQGTGGPTAAERLPDPLRERELEVLALIAAGKSNKEIAGTLFVSMGTVKTHINNLYRKLDVGSRTQAVSRAREIGVL
jgi:LuxR family maltose regulon positive regulatory protein